MTKKIGNHPLLLILISLTIASCQGSKSGNSQANDLTDPKGVSLDRNGVLVDGRYRLIRGGTLQWFRMPRSEWEDRLRKFKAAGFNTVDVYVPWNFHEPVDGVFDFTTYDLQGFLRRVQAHGLYAYLRPGPYITNEMDGGGVPAWLLTKTSKSRYNASRSDGFVNMRTFDWDWMSYTTRYLQQVNFQIKPFLASRGGPIIFYAIENEYNWAEYFFGTSPVNRFQFNEMSFQFQGQPERGPSQIYDTTLYLNGLVQFLRKDGIDIPITTCPGIESPAGMGDSRDLVPMPNVHSSAKYAEQTAFTYLDDVRRSGNYQDRFANWPMVITETDRHPSTMVRLLMGGADGIFHFNLAGFSQPGLLNSVISGGGDARTYLQTAEALAAQMSASHWHSGFIKPKIGYLSNILDYYGPISPSGMLRQSFYTFKKFNQFFTAFEHLIAPISQAQRYHKETDIVGYNPRVQILNDDFGVKEGKYIPGQNHDPHTWRKIPYPWDGSLFRSRTSYWLQANDGTIFVELLNNQGKDLILKPQQLKINDSLYPRWTKVTVPKELTDSPLDDSPSTEEHIMPYIVTANWPIFDGLRLEFSSSRILTQQHFGSGKLLVLYHRTGEPGEIHFSGNGIRPTAISPDINLVNNTGKEISAGFIHKDKPQHLVISANDRPLHVVIMNEKTAERTWSVSIPGKESPILLIGPNLLTQDPDKKAWLYEWEVGTDPELYAIAPGLVDIVNMQTHHYDPNTNTTQFVPKAAPRPTFSEITIQSVATIPHPMPKSESLWTSLGSELKEMEFFGHYRGAAWYQGSFFMPPGEDKKKYTHLVIDHASDIAALYLNDRYLLTVNPLGTEVNSKSLNTSYSFEIPESWIREGDNTLTVRTTIWGHGSFMWPKGGLIVAGMATDFSIPALGFDSLKGLKGNAIVRDIKINKSG